MKHYLVVYNGNYADEFDVYFHTVMTEKELEQAKEDVSTWEDNEEREFYFGSNEEIYVIKEEVLECLNYAKEITDEENKVLTRLGIDYISFGDGLNWNRILNYE